MTTFAKNDVIPMVGMELANERRKLVEVEVVQKPDSRTSRASLERKVVLYLKKIGLPESLVLKKFEGTTLEKDVETLEICLDILSDLSKADIFVFVFSLNRDGPEDEDISEGDGEEVSAATIRKLPAAELQGLWKSLVFGTGVKNELVNYVLTSLALARQGVDSNLVGINRVALLHGPPGTGKTSLCRALANKLAVRMGDSFKQGLLIEINSHSLFSKWFSESGKLVQRMFDQIKKKVADKNNFVVVLIDEVESLTSARKNAGSGLECSDAIRVVNALLTQIDSIKQSPNVLVLTTSNITGHIDLAFVDRADIKQYVGLPTQTAIYTIYMSALQELANKDVVQRDLGLQSTMELQDPKCHPSQASQMLWEIAGQSLGFSGRTLRKLPFLALAHCQQTAAWPGMEVETFLELLSCAVVRQAREREELGNSTNTA